MQGITHTFHHLKRERNLCNTGLSIFDELLPVLSQKGYQANTLFCIGESAHFPYDSGAPGLCFVNQLASQPEIKVNSAKD